GTAAPPRPSPPELADVAGRLAALAPGLALGRPPPAPELAACAGFLRARHELNRGHVEQIAAATALPIVELPYLAEGASGPATLPRLVDALLDAPCPVLP